MNRPTFSWPSEWRATPVADEGTPLALVARIHPCPDCGALRRGSGPHAPRWTDRGLVDCRGRLLRAAVKP